MLRRMLENRNHCTRLELYGLCIVRIGPGRKANGLVGVGAMGRWDGRFAGPAAYQCFRVDTKTNYSLPLPSKRLNAQKMANNFRITFDQNETLIGRSNTFGWFKLWTSKSITQLTEKSAKQRKLISNDNDNNNSNNQNQVDERMKAKEKKQQQCRQSTYAKQRWLSMRCSLELSDSMPEKTFTCVAKTPRHGTSTMIIVMTTATTVSIQTFAKSGSLCA